jgi:hypothetical protein
MYLQFALLGITGFLDFVHRPWPESASELYRLAKLVPTFPDRRVSRSQHDGSPKAVLSAF